MRHRVSVAALIALGLWTGMVWAEAPRRGNAGANRPERGEVRKEFREAVEKFTAEQHERRKDHYEKQMEENRDFWKTIKGETPADMVVGIKRHRETQFNENKQFAAAQESKREDFARSFAAEHNLPQEAVSKIMARIDERYQEATAHFTTQHDENMAFLDKLAAMSDLTREKLKAALKEHYEAQKAENKAFFEKFKRKARP